MRDAVTAAAVLRPQIFDISNAEDFRRIALETFRYQFLHNPVYRSYAAALNRTPGVVQRLDDVPFLPIRFFKSHRIVSGEGEPDVVFRSSGTTSADRSRHLVTDPSLYRESFTRYFESVYGPVEKLCVLGLLPSYLEQGESSLVYMVNELIKKTGHPDSGFYLHDYDRLRQTLLRLERAAQPTVLFGVTYALLRFAAEHPMPLRCTAVVETGGMKGRGKELSKPELLDELRAAFSTSEIHSEYGMTELLSQAYGVNGLYRTPPWMKVVLRDETDPLSTGAQRGAVNVIDLANLYSCSFIATDDLGRMHRDGRFEVLGRMDYTDVRGCSQMAP